MLNVQVTNVLSKFSSANYQVISKNLKRLIIGFDLAVYFQNRKEITELLNSDSFNWSNQEHRDLSQNMILMCADNCACFKSFDTSKKFTLNFSKELQMQVIHPC